jgi:hypothetical protein
MRMREHFMRTAACLMVAIGVGGFLISAVRFRTQRSFWDPNTASKGVDYAGSVVSSPTPAFYVATVIAALFIGLGIVLWRRASA